MLRRIPNCLTSLDLQMNPFDKDGLLLFADCIAESSFHLTDVRVSFYYSKHDDLSAKMKLNHWLLLNRAGRSKVSMAFSNQTDQPLVEWTETLAEAEAVYGLNALYYMIRKCPWLLVHG